MTSDMFQLLTAITGGLIPAVIKLIIAFKKPTPVPPNDDDGGTKESPTKRPFFSAKSVIACAVFIGVGFVIGMMTKESAPIVELYEKGDRVAISKRKINEIDREIRDIRIAGEPDPADRRKIEELQRRRARFVRARDRDSGIDQ